MTAIDDVNELLTQYQIALGELVKGNPQPVKKMWSHREDATLNNPLGPPAHGWEQISKAIEHAASQMRDGEFVGSDMIEKHVTPELAYVVIMERAKAKFGGREDITPLTLRVTMIFRPEEGTWKVVHRHADPITTAQSAETLIQK